MTVNISSDVYRLLESISGNLEKLFENLEMSDTTFEIKTPNSVVKILQTLLANGVFTENIVAINERIKLAAQKSEEMHMDLFSNKFCMDDYEKKLGELEQSINEKNMQIRKLQEEVESAQQSLEAKKREDAGLMKEKDKLQMNFIDSLIAFRDSIVLRDGLASNGEQVDGNKLLTSLLKETARILEKNGVKPLEEKGDFDSSIQIVTDVVDTDKKELHDTVSHVFRAGYVFGNKMIRPQEVILYRYCGE